MKANMILLYIISYIITQNAEFVNIKTRPKEGFFGREFIIFYRDSTAHTGRIPHTDRFGYRNGNGTPDTRIHQ